jgi:hypothetical protein
MPWWIFGNRANFFAAGGVDRVVARQTFSSSAAVTKK